MGRSVGYTSMLLYSTYYYYPVISTNRNIILKDIRNNNFIIPFNIYGNIRLHKFTRKLKVGRLVTLPCFYPSVSRWLSFIIPNFSFNDWLET